MVLIIKGKKNKQWEKHNLDNLSKMNKKKTYQIISIVITLFGIGYTGYADGKGLDNNYGLIITGFGIALSLFILLFSKKEKSENN